jgi:hypothetical protein
MRAYLVSATHSGHCVERLRETVVHRVDLSILLIRRADEQVVGDVVEVTAVPVATLLGLVVCKEVAGATVLEPRSRHADVVGGAFALGLKSVMRLTVCCRSQSDDLNEDGSAGDVFAVPLREGLEQLQKHHKDE